MKRKLRLIYFGPDECWGNSSYALGRISNLDAAEYSGAARALALLPTAGALIGAPAKDMWYICKLMSIAGIFTMLLGLGGVYRFLVTADRHLSLSSMGTLYFRGPGSRLGGAMLTHSGRKLDPTICS